jgi:hypothetical protein
MEVNHQARGALRGWGGMQTDRERERERERDREMKV